MVNPPPPPVNMTNEGQDNAPNETNTSDRSSSIQPGVAALVLGNNNSIFENSNFGTITVSTTTSVSSVSGPPLTPNQSNTSPKRQRHSPDRLDPSPLKQQAISPSANTEGAQLQQLGIGKQLYVPVPINRRTISLLGKDEDEERLLDGGGYDSDGGIGPFADATMSEVSIESYNEEGGATASWQEQGHLRDEEPQEKLIWGNIVSC